MKNRRRLEHFKSIELRLRESELRASLISLGIHEENDEAGQEQEG